MVGLQRSTHRLSLSVIIGIALIAGSWLGKRIVVRLDAAAFVLVVEILLGIAGTLMVLGI